jgi:uncharacterized protein
MTPEFDKPLIGIDLGASYTKIGLRDSWLTGQFFDKNTKIIPIDGEEMVPSMVVRRAKDKRAWLFGQEAAEYTPVDGDKVYTNWKKGLFDTDLTLRSAESVDVAGHFFAWLRGKLEAEGIDAGECNVRLCMPEFKNIKKTAQILAEAMARNGWNGPRISNVSEPNANSIGIFTEGCNRLRRASGGNIEPVVANIYESSPILSAFMQQLATGFRNFHVAILDIGSFTTDLQLVEYNVNAEPDFIQRTYQSSYPIGMLDDFEKPLFDGLRRKRTFNVAETTLNDRERIKDAVCNGGQYVFADRSGKKHVFEHAACVTLAKMVANDFASKAWERVYPEIKLAKAQKVILTGGGAAAQPIRASLTDCIKSAGLSVTTLPKASAKNFDLSRLATALGAGSVLFEFPRTIVSHSPYSTAIRTRPHECRCRGGNKNCMFCGGSGTYVPDS